MPPPPVFGQPHFRRIIDKTPTRHEDTMHDGPDEISEAESPEAARGAFNKLAAELEGKTDRALEALELGLEDATAVLNLPNKYRERLGRPTIWWSGCSRK